MKACSRFVSVTMPSMPASSTTGMAPISRSTMSRAARVGVSFQGRQCTGALITSRTSCTPGTGRPSSSFNRERANRSEVASRRSRSERIPTTWLPSTTGRCRKPYFSSSRRASSRLAPVSTLTGFGVMCVMSEVATVLSEPAPLGLAVSVMPGS